MRQWMHVIAIVMAVAGLVACGRSERERRAEEAAKAAEQASKERESAAKEAAQGIEQMAQGLGELAKGLGGATGGDGQPIEPVSFKELQAVFPSIDGWDMGKPTGERMSMPVKFSQAKVTYTKGDARVNAEVTDSALNQMLLAPFAMFLTSGYEKETEEGYERSTKVGGFPGWERWNSERKEGEVTALVNKRFLVKFDGDNIESLAVLHEMATAADLAKLAAIR
jgi:hypothetical protein